MKRYLLKLPIAVLMIIGLILVGLALIPFGLIALLVGKNQTLEMLNGIKFTTNESKNDKTDPFAGRFS